MVDWSPNAALIPIEPTTSDAIVAALTGVHPNLTAELKVWCICVLESSRWLIDSVCMYRRTCSPDFTT